MKRNKEPQVMLYVTAIPQHGQGLATGLKKPIYDGTVLKHDMF